jgi:hypothetical protein
LKWCSRMPAPFTLAVDVGNPKNVGWASSEHPTKVQSGFDQAIGLFAAHLREEGCATIGFEAPIWTPNSARLRRGFARRTSCARPQVVKKRWRPTAQSTSLCATSRIMEGGQHASNVAAFSRGPCGAGQQAHAFDIRPSRHPLPVIIESARRSVKQRASTADRAPKIGRQ